MCTGFPLPLSFWHFIVRLKDFPQPMERGSHMHRSLYGKAYRGALLLSFFFFFQVGKKLLSVHRFQKMMATVLEMLTTPRVFM